MPDTADWNGLRSKKLSAVKEVLLAFCPHRILSAGKLWALVSMAIHERLIWCFLLLYNVMYSGCYLTQTVHSFVEMWTLRFMQLPVSEAWPVQCTFAGKDHSFLLFPRAHVPRAQGYQHCKLHQMCCNRGARRKMKEEKEWALELSSSPSLRQVVPEKTQRHLEQWR